MAKSSIPLTQERLKQLLDYDPVTGVFTRKTTVSPNAVAGSVCGWKHGKGYLKTNIDGRKYFLQRLAFLYMLGHWPNPEPDHENRNRSDNSWKNLREATRSQNNANHRVRCDNTSGFRGVYWNNQRQKWQAKITINHQETHLGFFTDASDANAAYRSAAIKHFGEFAMVKS